MKYFSRNTQKITINLTGLIDILFLIIIFFSVTTRFDNEREKKLSLPSSTESKKEAVENRLEISVNEDKEIRVDDFLFNSIADLSSFLEDHQSPRSKDVLLRIDKSVDHGFVISILDVLKIHKFEQVSFGTTL